MELKQLLAEKRDNVVDSTLILALQLPFENSHGQVDTPSTKNAPTDLTLGWVEENN